MCDCNNSLSLHCLCQMNLLRYADDEFTATPTYSNFTPLIPDGTLYRENYTIAGAASQVRRCSVDTWDEYLGPLPKADLTTYFRDGVYDIVCDGERVYMIGLGKPSGTRLIVINAASSSIETSQTVFLGDYATTGSGYQGSVNSGRISVGPYGVDFFPTSAKIRVPRNGANWGAPQIVSPFVTLNALFSAGDPALNKPGWTVYRTETRYNQPRYNRGSVAIAAGVVIRRQIADPNVYETTLRVRLGTLNAAGQFVGGAIVWQEEFPTYCYAPGVACAELNGTTFWSAHTPLDQFNGGVAQAKGLTPWGSFNVGGLGSGVSVQNAYFHEVYPAGLAVSWLYAPNAFAFGFSDGTTTWRRDTLAVEHINSDAGAIWVSDRGTSGGRMRRYRKDGLAYETVALPNDIGFWGDPYKDGVGLAAGLASARIGLDTQHHGTTPLETFKLDDCFAGGPPSALAG